MIKIGRLWGDAKFNSLSNNSKLLYVYLATSPYINSVGVLSPNTDVIKSQLRFSLDDLRDASKGLLSSNFIVIKKVGGVIYFIVREHFNSLPKSESVINKTSKDIEGLPSELQMTLKGMGIEPSGKILKFVKPTEKEVLEYSMSKGYKVNANTFIDYYDNQAKSRGREGVWVNSKGKLVRDWRATLKKVWFKDDQKLVSCKDSPKGFEYFYIDVGGNMITPDGWRAGKPYSKNFLHNKQMLKEFKIKTDGI